MFDTRPVGVFDSGIGGLTVFKAIREILPHESLIYLGDTARVPYGTKSSETIVRYSLENAEFLLNRDVKAIVVACNTSSAYALPAIQSKNGVPVIGVIEPGAQAALKATKNNHIGVIGTNSTINSNQYAKVLKSLNSELKIISLACPLFVPLAEEGWVDNEVAFAAAKRYLETMKNEDIDTLILGCTHYPLLKSVIGKVLGDKVKLVDSAISTANTLKQMLNENNLNAKEKAQPEYHIYVTDLSDKFEMTLSRFLDHNVPPIKRVEL